MCNVYSNPTLVALTHNQVRLSAAIQDLDQDLPPVVTRGMLLETVGVGSGGGGHAAGDDGGGGGGGGGACYSRGIHR